MNNFSTFKMNQFQTKIIIFLHQFFFFSNFSNYLLPSREVDFLEYVRPTRFETSLHGASIRDAFSIHPTHKPYGFVILLIKNKKIKILFSLIFIKSIVAQSLRVGNGLSRSDPIFLGS